MASMTMTASFLGGAAAARQLPATNRRNASVVRASMDSGKTVAKTEEEKSNTRRGMMLAVTAAAVSVVAKVAMADEEPKRGTAAAKKKYAPVCVTMPTARICKN